MGLYVGSTPVFTYASFAALMRELPDGFEEPSLTALFLGQPVDSKELRRVLDIRVRAAAKTPRADSIIDSAIDALKE